MKHLRSPELRKRNPRHLNGKQRRSYEEFHQSNLPKYFLTSMVLCVPSNRRHMVPYASAVGASGKNFDISVKNYKNPPKWLRNSSQSNALPNTCFMSAPRITTHKTRCTRAPKARARKLCYFGANLRRVVKLLKNAPNCVYGGAASRLKVLAKRANENFEGATTHPRADFALSEMQSAQRERFEAVRMNSSTTYLFA